MTEEQLNDWVAALRSGKYAQGRRKLKARAMDGNYYCCLGVFAEINDLFEEGCDYLKEGEYHRATLPTKYVNDDAQFKLTRMNDREGKDFNEIADFIDQNRELLLNG